MFLGALRLVKLGIYARIPKWLADVREIKYQVMKGECSEAVEVKGQGLGGGGVAVQLITFPPFTLSLFTWVLPAYLPESEIGLAKAARVRTDA